MDYRRIYNAFIEDRLAKSGDKTKRPNMERHHIIPKCLDGSNAAENLVNLTYSDHIFAHLLLAKIYGGKLAIAFQKMTTVERYRGQHTRVAHAALMEEARNAKGASMRGKKHRGKQGAHLRSYNASRRGQGLCPKLLEARKRQGDERRGKPAHPNSIIAASRSGDDRTPAQIERNRSIAESRRGKPPHPNSLKAMMESAERRRGQSWSQARRDAQNARSLAI